MVFLPDLLRMCYLRVLFIICLEYKLLVGKSQSALFTVVSPLPRTGPGMQQELIKYVENEQMNNNK